MRAFTPRSFPCGLALLMAGLLTISGGATAQQAPDGNADVSVAHPTFTKQGPRLVIDGGHHNFHTVENRFAPLAALLRNDGYRVAGTKTPFSAAVLANADILVIANPLNAANVNQWALPTPSGFTPQEIAAVQRWVNDGGALLLIADHFPFAGAAADMAAAFGFTFVNGFVLRESRGGQADTATHSGQPDVFTVSEGSLRDDVITRGSAPEEAVTAVATFTGSAFKAPATARPLIVFPEGHVALLPQVAWQFSDKTPRHSAAGYLQGAVMTQGQGRIAVFGEAAMFTAQVAGRAPPQVRIGFNAPEAAENKQFILNLVRWLAGVASR